MSSMEIMKEGVRFKLNNFNNEGSQEVVFTHKLPDGTYAPGTTNEEVINMMIERLYALQKDHFSCENKVAIEALKMARKNLGKRLSKKVQHVQLLKEEKKLEKINQKYND